MSNPAVITLANASNRFGKFKRFVVEDNIGESIHLHIDNMRIDFTIKEFLEFSQTIRSSLKGLDLLKGYSINSFDEHFLSECSKFIPKLKAIKIEEIKLSKLKCIKRVYYKYGLSFTKLVPITKAPSYQYLQGNKAEFLDYTQFNYFNINNEQRLLSILASVKRNDYPFKDQYLVLCNGQNVIRDGQHRAAVLAYLHGENCKVKIMRFYFDTSRHRVNIIASNLKFGLIWLVKKLYKKMKSVY